LLSLLQTNPQAPLEQTGEEFGTVVPPSGQPMQPSPQESAFSSTQARGKPQACFPEPQGASFCAHVSVVGEHVATYPGSAVHGVQLVPQVAGRLLSTHFLTLLHQCHPFLQVMLHVPPVQTAVPLSSRGQVEQLGPQLVASLFMMHLLSHW
jgi:hypothetical protein